MLNSAMKRPVHKTLAGTEGLKGVKDGKARL